MIPIHHLIAAVLLAAGDAPPSDSASIDLNRMQGDWMVSSMVVNGMKMPDEEAQSLFRTVTGESYSVSRYRTEVGKGTFKLDAAKSPRTIDSISSGGANAGKPILGIYKFDGETLVICNAGPGLPRPIDFESKLLSQRTLIVWQPEVK